MTCARFDQVVGLYVEGDLPTEEHLHAHRHLESCPHCRGLAEEFTDSQQTVKSLSRKAVDPARLRAIRSRILEQLTAEASNPPGGIGRWLKQRRGWAYASIVLATGLGVIGGARWGTSTGEVDPPGSTVAVISPPAPSKVPRQPVLLPVSAAPDVKQQSAEPSAPVVPTTRPQDETQVMAKPVRDPAAAEATMATLDLGEHRFGRSDGPVADSPGIAGNTRKPGRRDIRIEGAVVSSWKTEEGKEPEPAGVMVKLATKDPNIVLYWIVDENGD